MSNYLKSFDVGVFVGRFQHVHSGHEFTINTGMKICDRMLVLVGSSQIKGTLYNPFDVETRIRMLREIYPDENVVKIHTLPDLDDDGRITPAWGRYVLDNIKQHIRKLPDIFIYGDDERRSAWFEAHLGEVKGIANFIVARAAHPISATTMREHLFWDEFDKWAKHANPKLHKHYDALRSELLNAPGLQEIVRSKLTHKEPWTPGPNPSIFASPAKLVV